MLLCYLHLGTTLTGPSFCLPQVRGAGELLMYASQAPSQVLLAGQPLEFQYTAGNSKLAVQLPQLKGLQADLTVSFA
jgi:hypothetical protein